MNTALDIARDVIRTEVQAIEAMLARMGERFDAAVQPIVAMRGRVVVLGMGKSGIIGQKIAATLASTGTPAFFVHPGEAFHGDLGMIKPIDVALLISNSGETEEVIRLLPFLQHQGNTVIAMTGKPDSTLGRNAHTVLDVGVAREACANNLAPTSSTTCTLVMGDALAVALSAIKGFQPEDFARFHPGGSLGRKLLTRVADVMRRDDLPVCAPHTAFREVVHTINHGRLGLVLVVHDGALVGIVTDGDVRRAFDRFEDRFEALREVSAADIMTRQPKTIAPDIKLADAEAQMQERKIGALVVTGADGAVQGVLQIYDI